MAHVAARQPAVAVVAVERIVASGIVLVGFDGLVVRDTHRIDRPGGVTGTEADLGKMPAAAQRADADLPIFEHERLAAVERLDPKILRENRAGSKNGKENDAHRKHLRLVFRS